MECAQNDGAAFGSLGDGDPDIIDFRKILPDDFPKFFRQVLGEFTELSAFGFAAEPPFVIMDNVLNLPSDRVKFLLNTFRILQVSFMDFEETVKHGLVFVNHGLIYKLILAHMDILR